MARNRQHQTRHPGESLPAGFDDDDDTTSPDPEALTAEGAQDGGEGIGAPAEAPLVTHPAPDAPGSTDDDEDGEDDQEQPEAVSDVRRPSTADLRHGQPPKGYIIRPGEKLTIPGEDMGNTIKVTDNVYRELVLRGSKTPTYTLVYRKGTEVAKTAFARLAQ